MSEQLVIIDTHPSHHHAAVYKLLAREGFDPLVCYGSDFSVQHDRSGFSGGSGLLAGYRHHFLAQSDDGADAIEYAGTGDLASRVKGARAVLIMSSTGAFSRSALRLSLSARSPVLLRVDAPNEAEGKARWRRALHDAKLRRVYARCVLLNSGKLARERLLRLGVSAERAQFAPVAIDASLYRATESDRQALRERARIDLGADDAAIVVLFSGPLVERKAPLLALNALASVDPLKRARFMIVFNGEGPLRSALQQAAARAGVRAVFPVTRSGGGQSAYHHAADLLVLPSPFEPWGITVNEALMHGLPVVVSDGVGCHPDLIVPGSTGEVFQANSAESLAQALTRAEPLVHSIETRNACRARIAPWSIEATASAIATAVRALHAERTTHAGSR